MSDIEPRELVGSWKLISIKTKFTDTEEVANVFGPDPLGYGVFTADGRWMVVITASGMSEPTSDQERATVFGAIGAYTGRFYIVGNKITINVDVATNPGLVGQQQVRFAQMSDGKLILTTPQSKLRWAGGREGIGHVVWERQQTAN